MSKEEFKQTERNQVRRLAKRGKYDKDSVYRILDEGRLCHIGFAVNEQPFVIPTLFARVDDVIYVHGSQISRMLKTLAQGVQLCLTVTLVDGLVLARSAFHHSMNYRSAVVFGTGKLVENDDEKRLALKAISDHLLPNRWEDCREPNLKELNVTSVIRIEIGDASAKVREGWPVDDKEDYELPVWAGILPVKQSFGEPVPDEQLSPEIKVPDYLSSKI